MYHNPFGIDDDGFGQFPGQRPAQAGAFSRKFRCYPVSFMNKDDLEGGDKIIMPPSALDILLRLNISYPMLFQLESLGGKKTHCGVLEFLAQEGHAYIPYWMMQNLNISEGDMITIRNVALERGNYVKFQPKTVDFLSISNPKSVLERSLRSFTCLSAGDSIPITYNGKEYWIDVLDVKPGLAVSIIETDINVDFAAPPGYVEPSAAKPQQSSSSNSGTVIFGGPSNPVADKSRASKGRKLVESSDSETDDEDEQNAKTVVKRFPGQGSVLRKQATGKVFNPVAATQAQKESEKPSEKMAASFTAFSGVGQTLRGKTVLAPPTTHEEDGPSDEDPGANGEEEENKNFTPFGGTGRKLRD
eukprot:Plantae.Rhodophyta-Purpureofilum_apyrenoidigerum.ctg17314.p1 GENE.Plantae.Rhodophyta-Purpureofilum_apyrenoidigerum.ctg17314~~Plantae.Rhodophyta-Purpureofilum_apyrenoidigerum.ctg17314.p1  ORF type:complete len:359 (+),score=72.63 Plantae.Rhodophyta-Purpureofilum_apyrenoidigerum.ctg17314:69-1145(+)